jgi:hypothetical protein
MLPVFFSTHHALLTFSIVILRNPLYVSLQIFFLFNQCSNLHLSYPFKYSFVLPNLFFFSRLFSFHVTFFLSIGGGGGEKCYGSICHKECILKANLSCSVKYVFASVSLEIYMSELQLYCTIVFFNRFFCNSSSYNAISNFFFPHVP